MKTLLLMDNESTVCLWRNQDPSHPQYNQKCGQVYSSTNKCYDHVRYDHIDRTMRTCQWGNCKKTSTTRCNLTNHLLTHINIVSGICHICDRQFKWKSDFKKHFTTHTKDEVKFNKMVDILFQ